MGFTTLQEATEHTPNAAQRVRNARRLWGLNHGNIGLMVVLSTNDVNQRHPCLDISAVDKTLQDIERAS